MGAIIAITIVIVYLYIGIRIAKIDNKADVKILESLGISGDQSYEDIVIYMSMWPILLACSLMKDFYRCLYKFVYDKLDEGQRALA